MSWGLYIHLPFCRSKCPYCGFSSAANAEELIESYVQAAACETDLRCTGVFDGNPRTLYIGGGTPSIVDASLIKTVLDRFLPFQGVEFTVEVNPDSIRESWLDSLLELGANRISIGIQSLDNGILANLGRIHDAEQGKRAVRLARHAGFRNVSTDLMFGVPGQTLDIFSKTLYEMLELEPDHISCYSLSIEEDTVFFERSRTKQLNLPGSSETADMYLFMSEQLETAGFVRYEISNFAHPGFECNHNKAYWDFSPYLGIGVSAHSFDGSVRRWNVSDIEQYIGLCRRGKDPVSDSELLTDEKLLMETVMLSLRTREGLSPGTLASADTSSGEKFHEIIDRYVETGFLEEHEGRVRLTTKGAVVSDELIAEIVAEIHY